MIILFRFRFSYFAVCAAACVCGLTAGRIFYSVFGAEDVFRSFDGGFFASFSDDFYTVLLPLVILGALSVTVYCVPVAIALLGLRSFADCYYILSVVGLMERGTVAFCVFCIGVHAFYTYGYFLLAMRCLVYRSKARLLPGSAHTVFRPGSLRFLGDYTSVAGAMTLCGLFSFAVMYYL